MDKDEIRELVRHLSAPKRYFAPGRLRLMIGYLYRHGLRVGEACGVKVEDIDFGRNVLYVAQGKGGKSRTLGLDPTVKEWTIEWIERLGLQQGLIFVTKTGKPWARTLVNAALINLARRAKIAKRVHPHCFRHTFAYELAMDGTPMPVIQRILGHSSLGTTSVYLDHVAPELIIKTMEDREWTI